MEIKTSIMDQNHTLEESPVIQLETVSSETALKNQEEQSYPLQWLTGEIALYILVVLVALSLRLANLDGTPLSNQEASQALLGFEIYHQEFSNTITGYSPIIATFSSFFYLLFGSSDWSARLASVILGTVLIVLPLGLRKQLGVLGAIASSILLSLSAMTLFWSRSANGEIAMAVGALLLLLGGVKWLLEAKTNGLYFMATGFVFLILSTASGYTALLSLLIATTIVIFVNKEALQTLQYKLKEDQTSLQGAAILMGGLLFTLATAGLFNLNGLAAISDLVNSWATQFGLQFQLLGNETYPIMFMLAFYEPLILIFGIGGVISTFWNKHPLNFLLTLWLALILIIDIVMVGRTGGQILIALIPLTLLAGKLIGELWQAWQEALNLEGEGLFLSVTLMISGFIYITLVNWSKCSEAQAGCNTAWILPASGLTFIIGLAIIFWYWYEPKMVWRGVGAILLITLACVSIGAAWHLNYAPIQDLPYQPLVRYYPSSRLPTLLNDLSEISTKHTGDPNLIDIAVVDLERPILHWYLRDFKQVRYVNDITATENARVILTHPEAGHPTAEGYAGQDFILSAHWSPVLEGKDWIRWYLLRYLPEYAPISDEVILWVKI